MHASPAAVLTVPGVCMRYSQPVVWRRVREAFQALRPAHEAMDTTRLNLTLSTPVIPKENILLIVGIHDLFAEGQPYEELWQKWQQPEIWRLPHGHVSAQFRLGLMGRASLAVAEIAFPNRPAFASFVLRTSDSAFPMIPRRFSKSSPDRGSHAPHEERMIASLTNLVSITRVAAVMVSSVMALCTASGQQREQTPKSIPELQAAIETILQETRTPGAGIAIVSRDKVEWAAGLGKADVAANQAATADTLFRIGSVSKAFVALAALQLQEEGKLKLTDTVKQWVPEVAFCNPVGGHRSRASRSLDGTHHRFR